MLKNKRNWSKQAKEQAKEQAKRDKQTQQHRGKQKHQSSGRHSKKKGQHSCTSSTASSTCTGDDDDGCDDADVDEESAGRAESAGWGQHDEDYVPDEVDTVDNHSETHMLDPDLEFEDEINRIPMADAPTTDAADGPAAKLNVPEMIRRSARAGRALFDSSVLATLDELSESSDVD